MGGKGSGRPKEAEKKRVTLYLEAQVASWVEAIKKDTGKSLGEVVQNIILAYVKSQSKSR